MFISGKHNILNTKMLKDFISCVIYLCNILLWYRMGLYSAEWHVGDQLVVEVAMELSLLSSIQFVYIVGSDVSNFLENGPFILVLCKKKKLQVQ